MPGRKLGLLLLICVAVSSSPRRAAADAFGGTIETIIGSRSVSLKVGKDAELRTVQIDAQSQITLDGKTVSAAELKSGMRAVVITEQERLIKLSARSDVSTSTSTTSPKTTIPKAPAKTAAPKTATSKARTGIAAWPQFRGPNHDNCSTETGLLKQWPTSGPKLLWTANGLGQGLSSVSVAGGLVLTMSNQGEIEGVAAVDFNSGKPAWGTPTGAAYHNSFGDGPRCVPTIDGELVYALGANGDMQCMDLADGKVRWKLNILQQTNGQNIRWGISESPLIDGDKVICTPGGSSGTMLALDKLSGKVIWTSPAVADAGYSSAVPATINGVKQYVQLTMKGVVGFNAANGAVLWQDASAANGTANCSAPLVQGNLVFYATGYGTGGALVQVGQGATVVYKTKDMKSHHGGMVLVNNHIYGCDDGTLTCLDFKTGAVKWQNRSVGKGSLTYADGHLIVRGERGSVALVEATPARYNEKGRFDPEKSDKQAWPYPVVAGGRLLLRDQDKLFCYDLRASAN